MPARLSRRSTVRMPVLRQRGGEPRRPFVAEMVPAVGARPRAPEVGIVRIDAADRRQEHQQRHAALAQQPVGGLDPGQRRLDLAVARQARRVLPVGRHVEVAGFPAHQRVEHPVEQVFLLAVVLRPRRCRRSGCRRATGPRRCGPRTARGSGRSWRSHDALQPFLGRRGDGGPELRLVVGRRLRPRAEEGRQVEAVDEQPVGPRHQEADQRAAGRFVDEARP